MLPVLPLPCSWEAKTAKAPMPVHHVEHGTLFYSVVFTWSLVTMGLPFNYNPFSEECVSLQAHEQSCRTPLLLNHNFPASERPHLPAPCTWMLSLVLTVWFDIEECSIKKLIAVSSQKEVQN